MKKLVVISIVALALTALSTAAAQVASGQGSEDASVSHELQITIPSLLMIRFTADLGSTDALQAAPELVAFVWTTENFEPVGTFPPTNDPNWGDIKVFANGGWDLDVTVENASSDFDWSKITVVDGAGAVRFTLPTDAGGSTSVLEGQARTNGWRSLGIAPEDYRLTLDGLEVVGTYDALVVYTISNP